MLNELEAVLRLKRGKSKPLAPQLLGEDSAKREELGRLFFKRARHSCLCAIGLLRRVDSRVRVERADAEVPTTPRLLQGSGSKGAKDVLAPLMLNSGGEPLCVAVCFVQHRLLWKNCQSKRFNRCPGQLWS